MNDQIHDKEQTMAHQADDNVIENVVQLLCESGLSHLADAMRLMLNEAMPARTNGPRSGAGMPTA